MPRAYREAEDAILARRAFAIVGIPPETEKNVLKGVTARLPIYADSTYFILFNRSLQGILEGRAGLRDRRADAWCAARKAPACRLPSRLRQPVDLIQVPLFNPTASYSAYVVPAAFVLILHQTLLMGAAMLGGAAFEEGGPAGPGLSHIRKQLEEERPIPPCEVHLAGDGTWQRMRTQDVQCHASNDG